ncbi:curved DNA-binding protein [Haloferula luteola]|uniref:Curved DNA-binding protein n=1 Tax=Haloferula luteola TaxID=595692 RepID=A0A840VBR8_9BACT|nr:DnaJ C-terminal domain-containing protein [Haloferula luteola]MBB5350331.1 curved DNA-binding protein [Haloferula luteola]
MSVEFRDYYEILGVPRDADGPAIKKAFRKRAREHHPDVAKDKEGSEERFKEINEAYEVLGDPEKRKRYDALGANWDSPGGAAPRESAWSGSVPDETADFEFGGTGFSDFFERYFSGHRGGHHHGARAEGFRRSGGPVRGSDVEGDLMVTLQEAMTGSMRRISLRRVDPQTGHVSVEEVQVRIPAGIREGQRLRVPGHGGPGWQGGEAGDLYLRVRLAADPDFRTHGHDLYRDLGVAPWDAVLGAMVPVTLPGGRRIQVKIPEGSQAGDQLRLKGYGLPKKDAPGDLYVVLAIEVPDSIQAQERKLWEQLRDLSSFQPEAG